ncbi:hypothetical protein PA2G_01665 [Pseudomonas aeruginosa 2192]|nr:hypothetical protein PA2G_01665 [Pseudomonas aeruginosa 2192]
MSRIWISSSQGIIAGSSSSLPASAQALDGDRGRLAAADADRRHAAFQVVLLQGVEQGHDDPRAGRADRMAQRTGAAVDVEALVGQVEVAHCRHADHGEGFVDLEQVDLAQRPAGTLHQALHRTDRRGGEQVRRVGERSMPTNRRQRREPASLGLGKAHQDQRGGAVGNRTGVGRGHRAAFAERRLQGRDLVQPGLRRLLVAIHQALGLAGGNRQRHDLGLEAPVAHGLLRAGQRGHGELVLCFAGEAVGLGTVLGEGAHQAALVVGVFEAVEEHVVEHLAVAHAVAATGALQQVGRVGHAFHAPGQRDPGAAGEQRVMGEHQRLHARAAHLVQRRARRAARQSGAKHRLARRRLALAGGEHAAEHGLVHFVGLQARPLHRGAHRRGTEGSGVDVLEVAEEAAHRGADGADDDDRIFAGHGIFLLY